MAAPKRPLSTRNLFLILALLAVVMVAIFAADTATDYAVAAAVFYIAVILAATRLLPARGVVWLAAACALLTVISFGLTHSGSYGVGLVNTSISIVAIFVTAYLALRLVSAEASEHLAREQLVRLARVTSMGELTASIAHEVNQPLAAIAASAGAARRWLEQEPPQLENGIKAIERITADADRAAKVIARIRGMAKGEAPTRSIFDLNTLILELEAMARSQIDLHNIDLRLYLDENLPPVRADRVQMGQVIGNLLINAVDALVASPNTPRALEIRTQQITPNTISIAVTDNGIGFAPIDMPRLFDAFWTTKKDGIGLGLTISRSIVEAHGGKIWAEAATGGGTVLCVELPAADGGANERAAK